RGDLKQRLVELNDPDYLEREILCFGPTPYMNAVKRMLVGKDLAMRNHREETIGGAPPVARADAVEHAEQAAEAAEEMDVADLNLVEFIGSEKSIRVAPGETVHASAAKVGLMIPKACGMGICGTCKVLKLGGEVEMEHNGGITEE